MTKAQELVSEIRAYCKQQQDRKQASRYARYFKEGYDSWGLLDKQHPIWTQKTGEWLARYRTLGLNGCLQAGELLLASGKYEEGALAIRFLARCRDELDAASFPRLGKWFEAGIRNWAHTDVLCGEVISPLLAGGRIGLEDLAAWRQSKHKYQRRAVPVGLLSLIKARQDVRGLLEFVRPLMMDPERVVQQGLGWFLREAWKAEPEPVEIFLLEWKDQAPRLIFQYVTEKMTPSARSRFRRAKLVG